MQIKNYKNIITLLILCLGVILNLLFIVYSFYYFSHNFYLPSPYYYDKSDTFNDFLGPLYNIITKNEGFYTDHYPVLSYITYIPTIFLNSIIGLNLKFAAMISLALYLFGLLYFLFLILIKLNVYKLNRKVGFLLLLFLSTSFPLFFAAERGNLIIISTLLLEISIIYQRKMGIFYFLAGCIKPYLFVLFPINFKINIKNTLIYMAVPFFMVEFLFRDSATIIFQNLINFQTGGVNSVREILSLQYSPTFLIGLLSSSNFIQLQFLPEILYLPIIIIIIFLCSVPLIFTLILYYSSQISDLNNSFKLATNLLIISSLILINYRLGGYSILLIYPFIGIIFSRNTSCYMCQILFCIVLLPLDLIANIRTDILYNIYISLSQVNSNVLWEYSLFQLIRTFLFYIFVIYLILFYINTYRLSINTRKNILD